MTVLKPSDPSHVDQMIPVSRHTVRSKCDLPDKIICHLTMMCFANHNEVCGFITNNNEIYVVDNIHEEPTHNFHMDQDSFGAVISEIYSQANRSILGVFHTHPNNVTWPTPRDLAGWPNPDLGWRYWIATCREVIQWNLV